MDEWNRFPPGSGVAGSSKIDRGRSLAYFAGAGGIPSHPVNGVLIDESVGCGGLEAWR